MLDLEGITGVLRTQGHVLAYAALVSTRVAVALAAMPAPFGSLAPLRLRASLSLILAFLLSVAHGAGSAQLPAEGLPLAAAGFGEALIGAVIGLTVRVTLASAEVAGTVASMSMGLGFAASVDPNYGEQSAPPTQLLAFLSTLIFLVFDGHHAVIVALSQSMIVAPPGQVIDTIASDGVIGIGSNMLARGLQIATPVLGTMMIVQTGLGLSSRAAPKVHLMYLSFAVSIGAGIVTLFVSAPSLATAIASEVRSLPDYLAAALGGG